MRYLNKIITSIVFIFLMCACSSNNQVAYKNELLSVERDEPYTIHEKLGNEFSISFWAKPETNYYGSTLLSLYDGKQTITLLTNSVDEDYYSTGIMLYHDNGAIYQNGNSSLDTYNYNYVTIRYKKNTFYLSLNGENIGNMMFSKNLKTRNLTINFGGELFKGEFKDIEIRNQFLSDESLLDTYNNNLINRLYNVDYKDEFKNNAYGKIKLPKTKLDIKYSSESEMLKIEDGYLVFEENNDENDKEVNLNVFATINDREVGKTISFVIKGKNDNNLVEDVGNKIKNSISYIISESNIFDTEIDDCNISYEVISGEAYFDSNTGRFVKNNNDDEKVEITIQATINYNDDLKQITKETKLIDEYYGYLLVYFNGYDGYPDYLTGDETIYFALSKDKVNWLKLTNKSLITTNEGSGRFRDPYIQRDKEGNFIIVATEAYRNVGTYIIDTNDFIDFNVKRVQFASHDSSLGLDGNEVWAPEFIYDGETGLYTITYSDPSDNCGGIFAVTTNDFKEFSYPFLFFNADRNVIDANVTFYDGKYYMFYKDEDECRVYYATTIDLNNGVWDVGENEAIECDNSVEGPELFVDHIQNNTTLYLDAYDSDFIMSSIINSSTDDASSNLVINTSLSSLNEVRHFSIIELTQKEYERIANYYEK